MAGARLHHHKWASKWLLVSISAPFLLNCATSARAQSIEPRTYSPAPVGMNFVVLGVADSKGALSFDPSLDLNNAHISVETLLTGYARSVDFWGKSGKIDVIIPYGELSGRAVYKSVPVARKVHGFADPLARISVILYGAPALRPAEFRSYKQDFLLAASVQVSFPLGQYDEERLINLGANRWSVKPEIGVSKTLGRWTAEFHAAATFFSANKDFFGGRRRTQEPLYAAQGHVIYSFPSGIWAAFDATYFTGGTTSVNGIGDRNLQENWRLGLTAAVPITRSISVKLNASKGVYARTGNNFDLFGAALQYRWSD